DSQQGATFGRVFPPRVIALASIVSTGMALLGGVLVAVSSETAKYGVTLFIALPVATGFTAGCFARSGPATLLTIALSLLLCFLALLVTGVEGIVCILMASPLIIVGALIGAGLGALVRRGNDPPANLALFPLVGTLGVFAVGAAEDRFGGPDRLEPIASTIVVDGTQEEVWKTILAMDEV